ncbi:MAG: mechanosensitive ion channel family protein, partial [Acholeplasmatales bacterium]
ILIFVVVAVLAERLFPGTAFAAVIAGSIGKFFNILRFFEDHYVVMLETLTVIFFIWVLNKVFAFMVRLFMRRNVHQETLGLIATSFIQYTSILVALFLILSAWGAEGRTLLAGAGILGLALSFGAQSLIEDVIAGLFILFEKQFEVGDVVEVNGFRGTVSEIGIRTTKITDMNQDTKILNNSDIRGAINTSKNLSIAIADLSIGYDADLNKVEAIIQAALPAFRNSIPEIVDGPHYHGVQELGESAVTLRILARTQENKKFHVRRQLNRALKLLCDQHQIDIPYPQLVIHKKD